MLTLVGELSRAQLISFIPLSSPFLQFQSCWSKLKKPIGRLGWAHVQFEALLSITWKCPCNQYKHKHKHKHRKSEVPSTSMKILQIDWWWATCYSNSGHTLVMLTFSNAFLDFLDLKKPFPSFNCFLVNATFHCFLG